MNTTTVWGMAGIKQYIYNYNSTEWYVPLNSRDFIEKHYVELKQQNPSFPFLIRECSGVEPKIYGRYGRSSTTRTPIRVHTCTY